MKIFSLQSKTGLVVWSAVLGFAFNFVGLIFSTINHWVDFESGKANPSILAGSSHLISIKCDYGFPFRFYDKLISFGGHVPVETGIKPIWFYFWIDSVFWILVVFIILLIIRYFRKKNYQIPTKV